MSVDDVSGFVSVLKENSGKWHKSYHNKFDTRQLQRKTAAASKFEPCTDHTESELTYPDQSDLLPDYKRWCILVLILLVKICYGLPNRSVFFCDLPASTGHLHD